jgi:hypothetical protein
MLLLPRWNARSQIITEVHDLKSKEEKKARGRSEWKEAV